MELMTLKQFADSKSISYEAVRKQVSRYHKELQGHIVTKNRTQYLDEWAISFLSERRRESPIVLLTEDQGDKIAELTEQVEALKAQLLKVQDDLITSKDRIIAMQDESRKLSEVQANYNMLLESHSLQEKRIKDMESDLTRADLQHEADQKRMDELQQDREDLKQEREDLRKERDDLQKKHEDLQRERDDLKQEQEDLRKERDELKTEANSYQRSLFGFYRKIK